MPRILASDELGRLIDQARGNSPAAVVIKGARYLSVMTGELLTGDIALCGERIVGVGESYVGRDEIDGRGLTVVPGFVDAHVHIESSMVTPYEFERCVLPLGTTTAVCDPHEMANVLGTPALDYFLAAAGGMLMDLRVQLCSCVPATSLETAGAALAVADIMPYKGNSRTCGLAEMMNFPGLLMKDSAVLAKIAAFSDGRIDGHCPLLGGRDLNAYSAAGVHNCHESTQLEEAREKLRKGMRIFVREGSVAKNLLTLCPLITPATAPFMAFVSDDRNLLDITSEGHIDSLIRRAIAAGVDPALAYRMASRSAAEAHGLDDRGVVAPGYRADLVLLSDYEGCRIERVICAGQVVDAGCFAARPAAPSLAFALNTVRLEPLSLRQLQQSVPAPVSSVSVPVIRVHAGSIITEREDCVLPVRDGLLCADPAVDILKVAVLERHGRNGNIGCGYVRGFSLHSGAIAASVGHDSHNICVVGSTDAAMVVAVNALRECGGGLCVVRGEDVMALLPLPIAGLLTDLPYEELTMRLRELSSSAAALGCKLPDPFLQLSFLPLPVIPFLKITDFGLVDVARFEVIAPF